MNACDALGLSISLDYDVVLSTAGRKIVAKAHISDLGPSRGMLVFSAPEEIHGFERELMELGYGYSVYGEPLPDEQFDLDSYIEMFSDWNGGPIGFRVS